MDKFWVLGKDIRKHLQGQTFFAAVQYGREHRMLLLLWSLDASVKTNETMKKEE